MNDHLISDAILAERDSLFKQLNLWDTKCESLETQLKQLQAMRSKNRGDVSARAVFERISLSISLYAYLLRSFLFFFLPHLCFLLFSRFTLFDLV